MLFVVHSRELMLLFLCTSEVLKKPNGALHLMLALHRPS